jgi:hypothetical protein
LPRELQDLEESWNESHQSNNNRSWDLCVLLQRVNLFRVEDMDLRRWGPITGGQVGPYRWKSSLRYIFSKALAWSKRWSWKDRRVSQLYRIPFNVFQKSLGTPLRPILFCIMTMHQVILQVWLLSI